MKEEIKIKEWKLEELKGRKLWVPYMADCAYLLASVFKSLGYESEVLPRSKDTLFSLGRKYTDGDQCLPSIITTEDILQRVFSPDFKQGEEAFFQGKSRGPCRFGRYYMNQSLILQELGKKDVPIFTLDNTDGYLGAGAKTKILAYNALMAQGLLERALHFSRPFETNNGESEDIYWKCIRDLSGIIENNKRKSELDIAFGIHNKNIIELLGRAREDFKKIKKTQEKKPVIFVTGEIYVRSSSVANQDLIKKIENLEGIALLEPVIAFFDYVNYERVKEEKERLLLGDLRGIPSFIKATRDIYFCQKDVKKLEESFDGFFEGFHEPSAREVVGLGERYLHPSYSGEAIVTLGGSQYYSRKVDGIINTMPFACMPGMVVKSKTNEFRLNNENIPFVNLEYDGNPNPRRDEQLEIFMYQVKERVKSKK